MNHVGSGPFRYIESPLPVFIFIYVLQASWESRQFGDPNFLGNLGISGSPNF